MMCFYIEYGTWEGCAVEGGRERDREREREREREGKEQETPRPLIKLRVMGHTQSIRSEKDAWESDD